MAAIASGILVARLVSFSKSELLAAMAAFLLLAALAFYRKARTLAAVCCCLGQVDTNVLRGVQLGNGITYLYESL